MPGPYLELPEGEPRFGPWRTVAVPKLLSALGFPGGSAGETAQRGPFVIAVDGRGAGGKSTLAEQLTAATPDSALLHTDDLAWHEPFFEWGHLLRQVLVPLRAGKAVDLRPPAWERMGRPGSLALPAGLSLVVVEGVGASQRDVVDLVDASVWMQSDRAEAERRGIERDVAQGVNGDREETVAFWFEWMAHEDRFLEVERPWDRADVVVLGTPTPGTVPAGHAVVDLEPGRVRAGAGSRPGDVEGSDR
ncbi:uridine kinase family protein [Salana multivorans]